MDSHVAAPCDMTLQRARLDLEQLGRLIPDREADSAPGAIPQAEADRVLRAQRQLRIMLARQLELPDVPCQAPIEIHHGQDEQDIAPGDPFHERQPGSQGHEGSGDEKQEKSAQWWVS